MNKNKSDNDNSIFWSVVKNTNSPQSYLKDFASALPNIIWITDAQGKMQFCNDFGLKYLGFKNSGVTDEEWASTVHPDEIDSIKELWIEALIHKEAFNNNQRQKNKNGDFEWFKVSAKPFFDEGGNIINWIGISINIDQEVRSSQKIKAVNDRLDLSIKNTRSGIWDWNIQKDKIIYNDNWWEILGYKKGELEESTSIWEKLLHKDDKELALKNLNNHLKGNTDFYESVYRLRTKSGEWLWVYDSGRVIDKDDKGNPLRFIGMQQDFTTRKHQEDIIKRSEKNMHALAKSAQKLMELKTADEIRQHCVDEIYNYINGEAIVNYTAYEDNTKTWRILIAKGQSILIKKITKLLGRPIEGLSGPTDQKALNLMNTGKLIYFKPDVPNVLPNKFQSRIIDKLIKLISMDKIYGIGIVKNDALHGDISIIPKNKNISLDKNYIEALVYQTASALERKEVEEKILFQNIELSELNKEMDMVINALSHDLKAPINTAKGILEIRKKVKNHEQDEELLTHVAKSIDRLDSITTDLLGMVYNNRSAIEKANVDLKSLIKEAIEYHESEQGFDKISWDIKVDQKAEFFVDLKRIKLILRNLLNNSIKYRDQNKSKNTIEILGFCNRNMLRLCVKDNGIGMNKAQLEKVFDMFYRADYSISGIGLGLHIIKQTVQKLDGTIEVNSALQEGTEIIFTIPNQGK